MRPAGTVPRVTGHIEVCLVAVEHFKPCMLCRCRAGPPCVGRRLARHPHSVVGRLNRDLKPAAKCYCSARMRGSAPALDAVLDQRLQQDAGHQNIESARLISFSTRSFSAPKRTTSMSR